MLSYFIYTHIHRNSWTHKTLLFCFFFSYLFPFILYFFILLSLDLYFLSFPPLSFSFPSPLYFFHYPSSSYIFLLLSLSPSPCQYPINACTSVKLATLFTGVKSCNLPSSLLAEEWIKTMQFLHMTKLFSILNMDEIILISGKWINHLSSSPSLVPFFCLLTI